MTAAAGGGTPGVRLALRALGSRRLALALVRLPWSSRAGDWYRRAPFLPLPPLEYVRWRMFTAYGDEDAVPSLEDVVRSEEHTSELQSPCNLVCRLLLEKKKKKDHRMLLCRATISHGR